MKSHLTRAPQMRKKIGKETLNTNEKKQDSIIRLHGTDVVKINGQPTILGMWKTLEAYKT